jgi:thiol-disulfide isomerase/thioredoxin
MAADKFGFGPHLISKAGPVETNEALRDKAFVMLYFSAHWCPPCRCDRDPTH